MCVVFTLNRSFYPTTSAVQPVSVLILHPRDTNSVVTQRQRKTKTTVVNQGKASEMLAHLVQYDNATKHARPAKYEKQELLNTNSTVVNVNVNGSPHQQ